MAQTYIATNKTGLVCPVYSDGLLSNKIGQIDPNEIFGIIGSSEGSVSRIIARIGGVKRDCYVNDISYTGKLYTPISDYPYGTITAWDYLSNEYRTHHTYYMNRAATVYDAGGAVWGSVAAGQLVAAKDYYAGQNGSTYPDRLQINYVRNTAGQWVAINNASGYVPIGLEHGSMQTTANIRGTW